jgi:acyl-coenzyme A thioesterase PaaI-like protein
MGKTEFELVKKRYLEKNKGEEESESTVDDEELPRAFLEHLILRGLRLHLIQPGRVLFSMNIPPRLLVRLSSFFFFFFFFFSFTIIFIYITLMMVFVLYLNYFQNSGNYLHGGAITTLVDLIGAAAIPAAGFPWDSGVSLEINVSCLDAAYAHVSIYNIYPIIQQEVKE